MRVCVLCDAWHVYCMFLFFRTMVNNHSLVDGSSSNVLVKLASSTPPSEVT